MAEVFKIVGHLVNICNGNCYRHGEHLVWGRSSWVARDDTAHAFWDFWISAANELKRELTDFSNLHLHLYLRVTSEGARVRKEDPSVAMNCAVVWLMLMIGLDDACTHAFAKLHSSWADQLTSLLIFVSSSKWVLSILGVWVWVCQCVRLKMRLCTCQCGWYSSVWVWGCRNMSVWSACVRVCHLFGVDERGSKELGRELHGCYFSCKVGKKPPMFCLRVNYVNYGIELWRALFPKWMEIQISVFEFLQITLWKILSVGDGP